MKVKIIKVFCYKNNWCSILVQKENGEKITAAGKIDFTPKEQEEIIIDASEYQHPTYGMQLKIHNAKKVIANSQNGILAYLKSGRFKGIGNTKAQAIVNKFGKESLNVLENTPDKFLEIPGINKELLDNMRKAHLAEENRLYMDIYNFFNGEITENMVRKIIETYKEKSLQVLQCSPYQLIYDIDGFAFLKVDKLARNAGIEITSEKRIKAAIMFILDSAASQKGHCYLNIQEIEENLLDVLLTMPKLADGHQTALKNALKDWKNKKDKFIKTYKPSNEEIVSCDLWDKHRNQILDAVADCLLDENDKGNIIIDNERIYSKKYYQAEVRSADSIAHMLSKTSVKQLEKCEIEHAIKNVEEEKGYKFDNIQRNAIYGSLINRIYIIYGGPGCGKTSVIQAIASAWNDKNKLFLLSHTGKAAKRIEEATGFSGSTVMQNIIKEPPKDALIIVDETSMVDILMLEKLLVFAQNSNLILVGDPKQLPSIGPGNVFQDLISSGKIPSIELECGYRNKGSISQNGKKLREEKVYFNNLIFDEDFMFFEHDRENILSFIWRRYNEAQKQYNYKDIIVIVPNKAKSSSGAVLVNQMIQEKLHPEQSGNFRIGDRVMYTRNNYRKEVSKHGKTIIGLFNGETGTIIKKDKEYNTITVLFDDEKEGIFTLSEQNELILAYCLTAYKSQGSEYPVVLTVFNNEHCFLLNRNLFLTVITRAKEHVEIIGDKKACNYAIYNTENRKRNTYLTERIKKL